MSARFSAESANWESPEKSDADSGAKSEKSNDGAGRRKKDGGVLLSGLIHEQAAGAGSEGGKATRAPLPVGELFVRRGPDALPEQERERKKKNRKKKTEGKTTALDETVELPDIADRAGVPEAPEESAAKREEAETESIELPHPFDTDEPKLFHEIPLELPPNRAYGGEFVIDLSGNKPPITAKTPVKPTAEAEPERPAEIPEPEPMPLAAAGAGGDGQPPSFEGGVPLGAEAPWPESGPGPMPISEPESAPGAPASEAEPPVDPLTPLTGIPRRPEPAEVYRMYAERDAAYSAAPEMPAVSAPAEEMVTKKQAEDAAYYATRKAQGRGVLAGMTVAALWARHRGKKLRRGFTEQFDKQERRHRRDMQDQKIYQDEQASRQAESNRRLMATETQLTQKQKELERQQAEQARGQREQTQVQQRQAEQLEQRDAQQPLAVPAGHRLETSAWHTIEIDERTGRPVEHPAFAYGREYYRERAHESRPADERSMIAGEMALAAAAVVHDTPDRRNTARGDSGHIVPPASLPSATRQGPPSSGIPSPDDDSSRDGLNRITAGGPIWPYVLAIVVIIVCITLLIR